MATEQTGNRAAAQGIDDEHMRRRRMALRIVVRDVVKVERPFEWRETEVRRFAARFDDLPDAIQRSPGFYSNYK